MIKNSLPSPLITLFHIYIVPNTNDLIQKFFDDCEPYLKKVVHLLHNEGIHVCVCVCLTKN